MRAVCLALPRFKSSAERSARKIIPVLHSHIAFSFLSLTAKEKVSLEMVSHKYVPMPKPDELSPKNPAEMGTLFEISTSVIRYTRVERIGMCHRDLLCINKVNYSVLNDYTIFVLLNFFFIYNF